MPLYDDGFRYTPSLECNTVYQGHEKYKNSPAYRKLVQMMMKLFDGYYNLDEEEVKEAVNFAWMKHCEKPKRKYR
jgi:hypothetical protein